MSGPVKTALVDLIAPPFAGHLHPLLGIGRVLAREMRVRVISTTSAAARVRASGLEPHIVLAGMDADIRAIAETRTTVGSDPRRLHAQFRSTLELLTRVRSELDALYRDPGERPDLAIVDFTLPVAGAAARAVGAAWWTSLPSPCVLETPDGPPAYLGGLRPRADLIGRVRDAAGRTLVRTFKRGVARIHRRALHAVGLDGPYRDDGSEAAYSAERILALGLRELEFARQWPRAVEFVGPIRYTPQGLGDPATLPLFQSGRRHVLVTLGTHLPHCKDRLATVTEAAACQLPDVTFHFTDGDIGAAGNGGAQKSTAAGCTNFQRRRFISYDLVPRYDLVVHHGGAGILYETIAAGLPAIVIPQDYDQFDNAARLEAAGLGHWLRSLDDLPDAIACALSDRASAVANASISTSAVSRRRYRDLIVNQQQSAEALVLALVRQRVAAFSPCT